MTIDLEMVRDARRRLADIRRRNPNMRAMTPADLEDLTRRDPSLGKKSTQYSIRFPDTLVERIDRYIGRVEQGLPPGAEFTRTAAILQLVMIGLDQVEQAELDE